MHRRRYSEWLIRQEELLTKRRDFTRNLVIAAGVLVAITEALLPWHNITPAIPAWLHIGVSALVLPILYFLLQNDHRAKLEAFTHTLDDLGRRLMFLDENLASEQFELLESYQGGVLRPTQRYLEERFKLGGHKKLRDRLNWFYRSMPSAVLESDRLGLLSLVHPKTAVSWVLAITLSLLLMPGVGITFGASSGLTVLPLLLPLYLAAAALNTRFAYELAMYNWLRLG